MVGPAKIGYQCLPVPSEWNAAGSIIGVKNRTVLQIGLVDGIKVKYSHVGVPNYVAASEIESGIVLKTLETFTVLKGWSANLSAAAKGTVNVATSYAGQTELAVTEGQPETQAINWFKVIKGYKVEDNTKYYLIREAIRATEVIYEVKRSDFAKLGGDAVVKAVEGKVNVVEKKSSDSYSLNAKFPTPLNVCIKPVELIVVSRSASGEQFLGFSEVNSPILSAR